LFLQQTQIKTIQINKQKIAFNLIFKSSYKFYC
jgi:hypothetical protein